MNILEIKLTEANFPPSEQQFIVNGFRFGFDLCYNGPLMRQSRARNLPFHVGNHQIMWQKLMKEVKLKRVAGPFDSVQFENFAQSPIGLVPKDGGLKTCLIFHLSYDFVDVPSVNLCTLANLCSVKYQDLDVAVNLCLQIIKEGGEVMYLSKTDAEIAFRILPLNKQSWPWVVMKALNPQTGRQMFAIWI